MAPSGTQKLDRDVYQVVRKLLDDENDAPAKVSVYSIYEKIKKSNSSLARRPKRQLEDSIERILSVLQETNAGGDTEAESSSEEEQEIAETNAMNKSMVKQWKKQRSERAASTVQDDPLTSHGGVNGDDASKKRIGSQHSSANERPLKKSKTTRQLAANSAPTHVSLADIGGMDSVIEYFVELLVLPLKLPERYLQRGLKIPRGILLHGPPGCGKTVLCEAIAAELGLPFLQIAAPSIVSGMSGESEKQIRQHFETALQMAPCIMFIDEIDAITPKRESAQREMERRIVGQLLTCLDDLSLEKTGGKPVIVLAATNRPDSLDSALRRAGRFDTEINIGVPDASVREQILRAQTRKTEVADDVDFARLAKMTPGFVGADLESLIYKAGSASNARYLKALRTASARQQLQAPQKDVETMDLDDGTVSSSPKLSATVASFRQLNALLSSPTELSQLDLPNDALTMTDFLTALPLVQPSSKREGFATIPDTTWASVGALHAVRKSLQSAIVEPIRHPERYHRFHLTAPAGVLLWGPPGCGKTLLAKAVANESRANFISIKGPELLNKYVGESERAVRQVFFRARSSAPCVVFFDELDALVPRRDDGMSDASARVVNTLLTELDGLGDRAGIYVVAATNCPEMIDAAMLRPGRLGKHLFVGLPGPGERVEILATLVRSMPVRDEAARQALAEFAGRVECSRFSGADLSNLVHEAAQRAVEENKEVLEVQDLEAAIGEVKASVGDLERYEKFKLGLAAF